MSSSISPETSPPFWKTFLRTALPFGAIFAAIEFFLLQQDPISAVVTSLISAGLFGAIMTVFLRSDWFRENTALSPADADEVQYSGAATYFSGLEGVGGRLFLTKDRLVFQPHSLNVQSEKQAWPVSVIEDAQLSRVFLVVPTGLDVQLSSGDTERFVTWDRKQWREVITSVAPEDRIAKNSG